MGRSASQQGVCVKRTSVSSLEEKGGKSGHWGKFKNNGQFCLASGRRLMNDTTNE